MEEIAKIKMPDLNCFDLEAAMRSVKGTARSMGVRRRVGQTRERTFGNLLEAFKRKNLKLSGRQGSLGVLCRLHQ